MAPPKSYAQAAGEWIRAQLISAFPENAPQTLFEYGDSLAAIAEQYQIPAESVIWWIHYRPDNKDFSLKAWRLWCARYADAAARLPAEAAAPPALPEAQATALLCTRCYARVVQRIDKLWWCSVCGEIQV
jgi:hypothetical protein